MSGIVLSILQMGKLRCKEDPWLPSRNKSKAGRKAKSNWFQAFGIYHCGVWPPYQELGSLTADSLYVQNYFVNSQYISFFKMEVRFLQGCKLLELTKKIIPSSPFGLKDPKQRHTIAAN